MSTSHRLLDALLTRDPKTRGWLVLTLITAGAYLLYAAIQLLQVHYGFAATLPSLLVFGTAIACSLGFYAAIRSGYSLRFRRDPSLGLTQLATGIVLFWAGYAINGPGGLTTPIVITSQVVYAMFGLPLRQVHALTLLSVLGLALLMCVCHLLAPLRYPAPQQVLALLYTALVLGLIVRLATMVGAMHERMRTQRNQLEAALEQVQRLAVRDELTQLPNRRHMAEQLRQMQQRHDRSGASACIALLDIDHFKRINDRQGHAAGDAVLRRFAQLGASVLRASDALARWGGEEFLLLMPDTTPAAGAAALQRLRALLSCSETDSSVTFSAGVVALRGGETVERCVERADRAMYRAKQAGRDRVIVDTDGTDGTDGEHGATSTRR